MRSRENLSRWKAEGREGARVCMYDCEERSLESLFVSFLSLNDCPKSLLPQNAVLRACSSG